MGTNIRFNSTIDESDHQLCFTRDQWRDYMKEKINLPVDDAPVINRQWLILKPPQELLEVKPLPYYPYLVSIGPLYQNRQSSRIDNFKALCVSKFMERHGISGVGELMQYLIATQPYKLRRIYGLDIDDSEIEWLRLLVTVDTVFIHEFLLYLSVPQPMESSCKYFATFIHNNVIPPMRIKRDLLLIGNQIPMSFLKKISNNPVDLEMTVRDFIVRCNPFFSTEVVRTRFLGFLKSENIKLVDTRQHLLDSLYYLCTVEEESARQTNSEESTRNYVHLPTASQLGDAGISFKACEGNISVMKYDKRKLQLHLPRLVVYNDTEDVLRNLIAHEITSRKQGELLTYVVIMKSLMDSQVDRAILKEAKVIENRTGNDQRFADMWRNMCIEVPDNGETRRWKQMMDDIVAHHSSHG